MKKIFLQSVMDKQVDTVRTDLKKYRIFLAWGVTTLFKNKKKATIFQASLNIWINEIFYELNSIYASLFYQYRCSWLFTSLYLDDRMTKNFQSIERNIHKLYRAEYRGKECVFYAFEAIEVLCQELDSCNTELIEYSQGKRDWEQIKKLKLNSNQLKRILKELIEISDPGPLGKQLKRKE